MAKAPADGENVHSGGDQLRCVGVAKGMERAVDIERLHRQPELLGEPMRRPRGPIPLGEDQGIVWCFTQPEGQPALLLTQTMGAQIRKQPGR